MMWLFSTSEFSHAMLNPSVHRPPVWLLELAGYSRLYGVESHEVVERLAGAGFVCAVYDPERGVLADTNEPWRMGAQNVIAVAKRHREFVDARLAQHRSSRA